VDISDDQPTFLEMKLLDIFDIFAAPTQMLEFVRSQRNVMCDAVYKSVQLNKIMEEKENSKFDVVIIETMGFGCESYLAHKLNLPLIIMVSSPMVTFIEHSIFGYIPNPATISHLYADYAIPETFVQRFSNTVLLGYSMILLSVDKWIKKYTVSRPYDWVPNTVQPSLIFLNSHFISDASRPLPQNVIQVGGIHLKPPKSIPNVSKITHITLTLMCVNVISD